MEIAAQQKKDSLKRPTAVAVIIVIVRRDGDKLGDKAPRPQKIEVPWALIPRYKCLTYIKRMLLASLSVPSVLR